MLEVLYVFALSNEITLAWVVFLLGALFGAAVLLQVREAWTDDGR